MTSTIQLISTTTVVIITLHCKTNGEVGEKGVQISRLRHMYFEFPAQAPYACSVSDTGGSEEKKLRSPPRGKICFKNIFTKDNGISSP